MAALHIDIDAFKAINDSFGHAVGDRFLVLAAERLVGVVREADTAARVAGDEFVVLVDGAGIYGGSELVAERVLEVLSAPYDLTGETGRMLTVTASVGIANGLEGTAEELFVDADVARFAAKEAGRDRCVVFESGMQTAAQERVSLEMDLREALTEGQLSVVYQPTFDLRTERMTGAEALLRWTHPVRGPIGPDVFVPVAESCGLIGAIGTWVLRTACAQARSWHDAGHPIGIAVNVSGRQLDDDAILDEVAATLRATRLPAESLTLEITETALMRDPDATARRLAALKRLGVRIAIDDFGTGYSSLAYLRQFPVDTLKIDRSFIRGMTDGGSESAALVRTLIQLGKTLGLTTLGEGVEDAAQLRELRREGCDSGQGYLFARPMPPQDVRALLRSGNELRTPAAA